MEYNIPAIPTLYRGQRYRSRLEARWAAFFDLLGWQHRYELRLLDGWLPDFELRLPDGDPVLAEVKPLIEFMPEIAVKMKRAAPGAQLLLLNGMSFDPPRGFCGGPGPEMCTGAIDQDDLLLGFVLDIEADRWRPAVLGWFGKVADALFLYHPAHPMGDGYTGLLSGLTDEDVRPRFDLRSAREMWGSTARAVSA